MSSKGIVYQFFYSIAWLDWRARNLFNFLFSMTIEQNLSAILILLWAVYAVGVSWWILVSLLLFFPVVALKTAPILWAMVKQLREIEKYLKARKGCFIQPIEFEDCIKAVDKAREPFLKPSTFVFFKTPVKNTVPLVSWIKPYASGASLDFAPQVKSFYAPAALWSRIYLTEHPSKMKNLQLFQLLHEIGHSRIDQSYLNIKSNVNVFLPLIVVAFLCDWSWVFSFPVVASFLVLQAGLFWSTKEEIKYSEILGEIEADDYALARSNPSWFEGYPAERVTDLLCNTDLDFQLSWFSRIILRDSIEKMKSRRKTIFLEKVKEIVGLGEWSGMYIKCFRSSLLHFVSVVLQIGISALALHGVIYFGVFKPLLVVLFIAIGIVLFFCFSMGLEVLKRYTDIMHEKLAVQKSNYDHGIKFEHDRLKKLRAMLANSPYISSDSRVEASKIVGAYSDKQVEGMLIEDSFEELIKKPAIVAELLFRYDSNKI